MDEERLDRLATAVSDGAEVDWEAEEKGAVSPSERQLVRALRSIDLLARVHRGAPGATSGEPDPLVGATWGRLEILEWVGSGSFGDVYKARDPQLDRIVALKLLRPARGSAEAILREGKLLARIKHPNVATVYGIDRIGERVGLWMEFLQGRTLSDLVRRHGPLGAREATLVGLDLCRALAAVHAQGILHGDVKAQNVIREAGGRIVLMDFSVGRELESIEPDEDAPVSGTPMYLAPEVLTGGSVGPASDIYSLGVLLYHLVSGEYPLSGGSLSEVLDSLRQGRIRRLRDLRPDLPERFVRVVERALAREPDARYGTAGELEAALAEVLSLDETSGRPAPSRGPGSRPRRFAAIAGTLALVLLAAGLGWRWSAARTAPRLEVLVAPFQNRTGDRFFDGCGLRLVQAVEETGRLRVLPIDTVGEILTRMERPADVALDLETAWEVARRADLDSLITGEIRSAENGFDLALRALEPTTGALQARLGEHLARREALGAAVRRLAGELPQAILEAALEARHEGPPLERVTTRSIRALERYSHAAELHAAEDIEGAIRQLETAVALDPDFAMAYNRLSVYLGGVGRFDEAQAASARAFELRSKGSEAEVYYIAATYYGDRLQYEQAAASFERLVAIAPGNAHVPRQLALLYASMGEMGLALRWAREAQRLGPENLINQGLVVVQLAEAGHPREALAELARIRRKRGEHAYFHWGEGAAYLGLEDYPAAERAFTALRDAGGVYESYGSRYLAQTYVLEGRLERAASELLQGSGPDRRRRVQNNDAVRTYWLAWIEALQGDRGAAARTLAAIEELPTQPIFLRHFRRAGLLAAELGDLSQADRLSRRLEELAAQYPSSFSRGAVLLLRAELALSHGDLDAAAQLAQRARREWSDPLALRTAARIEMARQAPRQALALWREMVSRRGQILRRDFGGILPLGYLELGRAAEAIGDRSGAAAAYRNVIRLWGREGAGLDVVRQAHGALAGLSAPASETPDDTPAATGAEAASPRPPYRKESAT